MSATTLKELEQRIRELSHSEGAIDEIETFSKGLKDTQERLSVFNADHAIVRPPIRPEETRALGFDGPDDTFAQLQGDVIITESAYFLGERVTGRPKYVVLNSSCDLVPGRREFAALLRIKEIKEAEPDAHKKLNLLLQFRRRESMYLPVLPIDGADVLCNVIQFDGICQIRSTDLTLANRIASMSLVAWRIFACFSRVVLARATPRECQMRIAIEQQPES